MLSNDKTMKQLHNDSFIDCIMKVASAPSINEEASQQLHQGMNQEMANLSRRRVALNTRHKDLMDILAKDYEQGVHRSDMNKSRPQSPRFSHGVKGGNRSTY